MSTTIKQPDSSTGGKPVATDMSRTLLDIVEALGGISLERIRVSPPLGQAREADLLLPTAKLCELIDGTLVEKPMGFRESTVGAALIMLFMTYFRKHNSGIVGGSDGQIRFGESIRLPDVSIFKKDRLPDTKASISNTIPNITIEVLSPSNTTKEMDSKRELYFKHDVEQCWFVDCEKKTVAVWSTPHDCHIYQEGDTIDVSAILPDLEIKVSEVFADLADHE